MNKRFLRRWPPGADSRQIGPYFIIGMVVAVLYSMGFLWDYMIYLRDIQENLTPMELADPNFREMLPTFAELIDGRFLFFPLYVVGFLSFVFFNYRYFWQESKSVYVMRRVCSPWELHLRCWTVPLAGAAVIVLTAAGLYLLYLGIYFWCAPEDIIPAQEIAFGWRYVP